jgi:carbamoyl-phosphate synthase large subunit
MAKIRNVLIFPGGTEIGLEIHEALRQCKEVNLLGAGSRASSHGPSVFSNYTFLPLVDEPEWLDELRNLCFKEKVDYIFPAHDDAIIALAENRDLIPAVVLVPPLSKCQIARSKRATYEAFKDFISVPKIFKSLPNSNDYPVFVKPNIGQGSQGANLVKSEAELNYLLTTNKDLVVTEFLPGQEYTVDCFSDRTNGVLFVGARLRERIRSGIAVSTRSVCIENINQIAEKIHEILGFYGAWFFQLKRAGNNELVLLEVAPRISGSMALNRVRGVNFPLLTIYEHERTPLKLFTSINDVKLDRALSNRFECDISYSNLYIDLDDTLILKDKINLDALRLVFQSLNNGVRCTLLTRHAGDLDLTLKKFRLDGIFDRVLKVDDRLSKADFIDNLDSIFVDDSFSERSDVHNKLGIKTFDCSMIELLIRCK